MAAGADPRLVNAGCETPAHIVVQIQDIQMMACFLDFLGKVLTSPSPSCPGGHELQGLCWGLPPPLRGELHGGGRHLPGDEQRGEHHVQVDRGSAGYMQHQEQDLRIQRWRAGV